MGTASTGTAPGIIPAGCLEELEQLTASIQRRGLWASGCTSINEANTYARYYSFSLGQPTAATMVLQSSHDTVLFLRGPSGDTKIVNDDVADGSGSSNSRISTTLSAGTYTMEAITFSQARTGAFTLTAGTNVGELTQDPVDPEVPVDPEDRSGLEHPGDREVLETLYRYANGDQWSLRSNHNWMTDAPIAEWQGVTVDEDGRVTLLNLAFNNLTGTLPAKLGDLSELEILHLGSNNLTGILPPALGNLSNLETLNLGFNDIRGSVPASFGSLSNLRSLTLNENRLGNLFGLPTGGWTAFNSRIPAELGQLANLQRLYLQNNELNGRIPPELGNLSSLLVLNLSGNRLSGEPPSELGNLTTLTSMNLSENQLTGRIPSRWGGSWGSLTSLTYLDLSDNQLSGEIPWQLGNRRTLKYLYLRNNNLSGGIPVADEGQSRTAGLENLDSVKTLDLGQNNLTGAIPAELALNDDLENLYLDLNELTGRIPSRWTSPLERLGLSHNQLAGEIPGGLGDLTNLTHLYLDQNQLTGQIPSSLGNLAVLEELNLWKNGFTGRVPAGLGNLTNLTLLSFSFNNLIGAIPAELSGLVKLEALYLNDNGLMGMIPVELGNLYSIQAIYLHRNQLTGCVPIALESIKGISRAIDDGPGNNNLTGVCRTEGEESDRAILARFFEATGGTEWEHEGLAWGSNWNTNQILNNWDGVTAENGRVTGLELPGKNLTGFIPWQLANLEELQILDLSNNDIGGHIPLTLTYQSKLKKLNSLALDGNGFSGCVPLGERFRALIEESNQHKIDAYEDSHWKALLRSLIDFLNLSNVEVAGEGTQITLSSAVSQVTLSEADYNKAIGTWRHVRNWTLKRTTLNQSQGGMCIWLVLGTWMGVTQELLCS